MIAQESEVSLHMASWKRAKRHEFITVEQLLLRLLDNRARKCCALRRNIETQKSSGFCAHPTVEAPGR